MILHRCPWCGEKIPFRLPVVQLLWKFANPDICPKCKKPYTSNTSRNSAIIFAAVLAAFYIYKYVIIKKFKNNSLVYLISGFVVIILIAIASVEVCRLPHARNIKKKERLYIIPKRTENVNLSWENHKNEGLLLPRFQVLNGEIFPACFMDENGYPISTAFCVVLDHFSWLDNYHCTCKIHLVLDDAPEKKLLRKGNQFNLYHNYRKIAKGIIL